MVSAIPAHTPADDLLARTAARAHDVAGLPAIATTDWCDRAAAILAAIAPTFRGRVAVMVADLAAGGAIRRIEAIGVVYRRAGELGGSVTPDSAASASLQRLSGVGFDPLTADGLLVGHLGAIARVDAWADMPLARALGGSSMQPTIVASVPLAGAGNARHLVIALAAEAAAPALEAGVASVVKALMPLLAARARTAFGDESSPSSAISDREQVVLNQLILGKSVRQIAEELGRSPHTVHDHVKSLHRKLNASSRGELIARVLGYVSKATRIRDTHRNTTG